MVRPYYNISALVTTEMCAHQTLMINYVPVINELPHVTQSSIMLIWEMCNKDVCKMRRIWLVVQCKPINLKNFKQKFFNQSFGKCRVALCVKMQFLTSCHVTASQGVNHQIMQEKSTDELDTIANTQWNICEILAYFALSFKWFYRCFFFNCTIYRYNHIRQYCITL